MTASDAKWNWQEKKVQLCRICNGSGVAPKQISMDETITVKCESCKGSGRVTKVTTVTYLPYEPESL